MIRTVHGGLTLAVALTVVTATAALAHPAFDPNQLPAGEAVDAVLVVPHGCDPGGGMPEDGASSPTVLVDLQLAPQVISFEGHEIEGWAIEREEEVVRWTATDGGTADPIRFPVTLTIDGPVDEPIYLSAFQECEEGSFRWIGTPDREAEYPAVRLTPTQGEIGAEPPDDRHAGTDDGGHATEDGHGHGTEDDHDEELEAPTPTEDGVDATPAADETAAADETTQDTGPSGSVVVIVVLALLAGAGLLWARRSRGSAT